MSAWRLCPECKTRGKLYKSKTRSVWEQALNYSKIFTIYRCHKCGWRGIMFENENAKKSSIKVVGYFILMIALYYITSYLITPYL